MEIQLYFSRYFIYKNKKSNKETTLNLLNCLGKPVLQLFQIFSQEGLGIPRACVVTSLIDN